MPPAQDQLLPVPACAHTEHQDNGLDDDYCASSCDEYCTTFLRHGEKGNCNSVMTTLVHPPRRPATDHEALDLIEKLTYYADDVQAQTLAAILERNANTEYLRKFGLQGRKDRASFKAFLPVITYEDLHPAIQRIANGDTSPILSAFPISEFLTSSGTSAGERKLMPTIHDEFERRCLLYSFLMPIMNQYLPDLDKGKGMYFYFIKSEVKTPGGLLARPVLTSYYKSPWFVDRPYDPYNVCTSPNETVLCADSFQSMYCQMLCGLLQRAEVLRMGAVFASGFLRAIRFLQEHWRQLCNDIRTGELSDVITDEPARKVVCRLLQADGRAVSNLDDSDQHRQRREELAESIAAACAGCEERGSWKGIIPLLWPHTKYIDVIVTGAMAQYIPTLDMYSGGLPLVCTMYASSECYFGVNMRPLCKPEEVAYTLIPNMAYFEFLPLNGRRGQLVCTREMSKQQQKELQLVELADVKVGHEYELVVTTYAGLYRYRVGDILRVTGFHNKAPQFQFVCRKNVALSIDSDKTDEETLHRAIEAATSTHLNDESVKLLEYTSYADLSTIPGHYVLFWELHYSSCTNRVAAVEDKEEIAGALECCCLEIEERLDSVYRQGRVSDKSIGPLEIRVVKPRTFEVLMDYCLSRGASINQYKAPRCVKAVPIIELMNSRVTAFFHSPRCPSWP